MVGFRLSNGREFFNRIGRSCHLSLRMNRRAEHAWKYCHHNEFQDAEIDGLHFLPNDERVHHYQWGRAPITGLKFWSGKVIETERLVVVVTARLVLPWLLMGEAFGLGKPVLMLPNSG